MQNIWVKLLLGASVLLLANCNQNSGNGRPLINLRSSSVAPDEFLVVPFSPLETPADLSTLPEPQPGSTNRASIDFEGRLITALGGRPAATGNAAADAGLINAVRATGGTTPGIVDLLAQEDRDFRDARSRQIDRLAKNRRAAAIYSDMLLDPYAELERLRALGVRTPAAPSE